MSKILARLKVDDDLPVKSSQTNGTTPSTVTSGSQLETDV